MAVLVSRADHNAMSVPAFDPDGQAREALASAVAGFGPQILSNSQLLENLFTDLLPDSPRERSILVTAAQVDVAAMLADRFAQHMDPQTAVRLTANALSERRALDSAACLWATTEFARALGHPLGDEPAPAPGPEIDGTSAGRGWEPESRLASEDLTGQRASQPPGGDPSSGPPPMPPPGPGPPEGATLTQGDERLKEMGAGGQQGAPRPSSPWSSARRRAFAAAVLAAVVIVIVAVVVLKPGPGPGPTTTTLPSTTTTLPSTTTTLPTTTTTTTPTTTTTTPIVIASLDSLAPGDDQDPTTCSPFNFDLSAAEQATVRNSVHCADGDLNVYVSGLQFDNFADYEAGAGNFNERADYIPDDVTSSCPPSGTQGGQNYSWSDSGLSGQLECFEDGGDMWYMWTFPSEDAFFWTDTATWSDVETWWSQGFADPDA